jgi:4-amino-4-deoxy-L-arabinose transferase-like glycosyltransferase
MTITAEPVTAEAAPARQRRDWTTFALPALLVATAALYLWDLGASGWANAYYSAAAQAGATGWKALLFGSTDAGNAITVDKTPASVWVMALSAKVFGVNAWSILVPQALEGVGTVWLLHNAVRRAAGSSAGLIAGVVLAATPVAALIFRYDNPDALLVLLLVGAAYAVVRACESASMRWLALAGALVGFAFLTKMLQAFLVLPAFAAAYLATAPTPLRKRFAHLGAATVAMVAAGGWWVALVELWPAGERPYIGGSQTNSVLELTFGYNGFGRLTGDEVGSVGGSPGGGWGSTGWARLFGSDMGSGIAWLLPAAVLAIGAILWLGKKTQAILWGGWLLVTAIVFSYMSGIIHPYYTVALAPAIAALVGIGATLCRRHRTDPRAAGLLASGVALTAITAYLLLNRDATWAPWLRPVVLIGGLMIAAGLAFAGHTGGRALAIGALVITLLAPVSYSLATANTPHSGAIPSVGPSGGGRGFGGGMGGLLDASTPGAALTSLLRNGSSGHTWAAATVMSNNAAGYQLASGAPVLAVGGFNGTDPYPTLARFQQYVAQGKIHYFLGDDRSELGEWVAAHFPATTVDGVTVYDLTASGT